MRALQVFSAGLVALLCASCGKDGDKTKPYVDTDTIDEDGCDPPSLDGGVLGNDGGVPIEAIVGSGDRGFYYETVGGLASFSDDSFVAVGAIENGSVFDKDGKNETTIHGNGEDPFVAKYDKDGRFLWVKHVIGDWYSDEHFNYARDVVVFSDDTFMVRGAFVKELIFEKGTDNETILKIPGDGSGGEFLASYDSDGNFLWAKRMVNGHTTHNQGRDFAVTEQTARLKDNSIILVGGYSDDVVFGPDQPHPVKLKKADRNTFIAKFDKKGEALWATDVGNHLWSISVASICDGHILVSARFENTQTLGTAPGLEMTVGESLGSGSLVAKFYPNGDLKNAFVYGAGISVRGLAGFENGTYVVAGDAGAGAKMTLFPGTQHEVFVGSGDVPYFVLSKLNTNDEPLWSKTAKMQRGININSVTAVNDGSTVVVGYFNDEVIFGEGEENETHLVAYGQGKPPLRDAFVAKFFSDGRLAWARALNGVDSTAPYKDEDVARDAVVLYGSNRVVVGGNIYGNFAIDYGTARQWPEDTYIPTTGGADWFVAILGL